jgi:hypothetical protein
MGKKIDQLDLYGSYDSDKIKADIIEVSKNSGTSLSPIYAPDGSRQMRLDDLATKLKLINPYTASNGLSMVGDDIQLGGTLTENTTLDLSSYDFVLKDGNVKILKSADVDVGISLYNNTSVFKGGLIFDKVRAVTSFYGPNPAGYLNIDGSRRGGIITSSPSAILHISGATGAAGFGALKIDSASLVPITEAGLFENDGIRPYYTNDLSVRNSIAFTSDLGGASSTEIGYLSGATSNIQNQINNINSGLSWKVAVRVATTANITLSGTQTIDGVSVVTGDRVLVKNQTTASQNGIYVCAAGSWSRATDATTGGSGSIGLLGATCLVEEGTANADKIFLCSTDAPITVGTTSITFIQTSSSSYTASNGIALSGNNFTFDNTYFSGDVTISSLGVLSIGSSKVTNAMLAGSIDLTTKVTGLLPDGNISSAATWNAKQSALSGSGIVKSASGTISYISGTSSQFVKGDGSLDSSTYLTTNQTITLSGDVSGSGSTSITTTIGAGKVTNTMLSGSISDGKLASSYLYADGTRALTSDWAVGTFSITGIKSFAISGTAGAGYGEFIAQSSTPSAPSATGFRLSAGSTGNFGWTKNDGGTDTFRRSFSGTLTANRVFTWQDSSYTVAGIDLVQSWTAAQTFKNSNLLLRNPADTFSYTIVPSAIAANRNLSLPLLSSDDTIAVLGTAQTFTAQQTFTGSAVQMPSLQLLDTTYKTAVDVSSANSVRIGNSFGTVTLAPGGTQVISATATVLTISKVTNVTGGLTNSGGAFSSTFNNSSSAAANTVIAELTGTYQLAASGAGSYTALLIDPTVNLTSASNTPVTLININPTLTSLTASNTIYGIRSQIASGTGTRWNIYADGTASNYIAGNTGIGTSSLGTAFLTVAAATTAKAAMNFISGTAPTSPNNGDFWFDGTNFKAQVGGVTKTFTIT